MRRFLDKFGKIMLIIFSFIVLAAFAPLIILAAMIVGGNSIIIAIARNLRGDPKRGLQMPEAHDDKWQKARTPQEFVESFNRIVKLISNKSDSRLGEIETEGFDDILTKPFDGWMDLKVKRSVWSAQGSLSASLEFVYGEINGERLADLADDESRCGSSFPTILLEWRSASGGRLLFYLHTDESLWFAIELLKSGYRLSQAKQAWVYVTKMNVWLVNYTVLKSDKSDRIGVSYGQRKQFSEKQAREYWLDE